MDKYKVMKNLENKMNTPPKQRPLVLTDEKEKK